MTLPTKLSALILAGAFLLGCSSSEADGPRARGNWGEGRNQDEQTQKPLSVRAEAADREPISTFIIANTTLSAIRDVVVYSKLNSLVTELAVEEGDKVREGQVLARLDHLEIQNEFEQARIAVQQAEVGLEQARVRAELSQSSFDRARSLYEQKLTSREEFDQVALANRTDALALEEAQRALEAARARLAAAQIQLDYTTIESPISGVVTERLIDVGDRVNVNEALYTVQEFPPLWARIYVPERSLPQLTIGQMTELRIETLPSRDFSGRIKMISPTVDSSSGTIKVTIELRNPDPILRPGMFGTVYIATETHEDAVVIPKKAILRERDQNFAFVVNEDSTVSRREVGLGFTEANRVEILEGIEAGELVVTVGVETLNDGYPVIVQNRENGPATSPGTSEKAETADRGPSTPGAPGADWGERLLQNPEVKKRYEAALEEDPSLATDPEKRRAFFREVMSELRGGGSVQ